MSFRLVSKSVTLNDLERRNGRYLALFLRIRVASGAHCVYKSSRSLYHLLMSSCSLLRVTLMELDSDIDVVSSQLLRPFCYADITFDLRYELASEVLLLSLLLLLLLPD